MTVAYFESARLYPFGVHPSSRTGSSVYARAMIEPHVGDIVDPFLEASRARSYAKYIFKRLQGQLTGEGAPAFLHEKYKTDQCYNSSRHTDKHIYDASNIADRDTWVRRLVDRRCNRSCPNW